MVAPRKPKKTPQMFMGATAAPAAPQPAGMFSAPLARPKRDFDWASLLQGVGAGLLTGNNVGEGLGQGLILARQFADQRADNERYDRRDQREEEKYQYQLGKDQQATTQAAEEKAARDAAIDQLPIDPAVKAVLKATDSAPGYGDLVPKADKGPAGVQEYEYAKQQGYQGSYLDFQLEQKRAGAASTRVDIHSPSSPMIGTIPPGYVAVPDGQGKWVYEKIPGGPAADEAAAAADKATGADKSQKLTATIVTQDIARAKEIIRSSTLPATGLVGDFLKNTGSTAANDLRATLQTIKANIGFDKLQEMRNNSPTGGALGPVSDVENALLQSTFGSLEQSQTVEQFERNLDRLNLIYDEIINGPKTRTKDDDARPATVIDGYTIRPK